MLRPEPFETQVYAKTCLFEQQGMCGESNAFYVDLWIDWQEFYYTTYLSNKLDLVKTELWIDS